jgi:uncharacterized protein YqgC (DUF456 family)
MDTVVAIVAGLAIAVGLTGTVLAPLPSIPLIWTAVLVWASIENVAAAWAVAGVATAIALANYLVQHRLAGGRLADLALAGWSVSIGVAAGLLGLLAVRGPLGVIIGFVGGTYVAERRRISRQAAAAVVRAAGRGAVGRGLAGRGAARPAPALPAKGFTFGRANIVELVAGLLVSGAWLVAVVG